MKTEDRLSTNSGLRLTHPMQQPCTTHLTAKQLLGQEKNREHYRGRLAGILQDCNSCGFGKVRSSGTRKIQRQIKSNCEHPKQLCSSRMLNPKLENGYLL